MPRIVIIVALLATTTAFASNNPTVEARLRNVTVYRSGAEMTHDFKATLMKGSLELLVEGLSNQVDINSIQITCPSAVTLLGTEYSNNFLVSAELTPVMRKLKDSLASLTKMESSISVRIATTNELLEVLKANRDIKGQQAGLSVTELVKLMDYYEAKANELQQRLGRQREELQMIVENILKIRKQITEEEKKNTRSSGRLTLRLSSAMNGMADFTISYITQQAYWTPYYDIRVENTRDPMRLVYKAKLVQTTGIDWKQVKLSLSTSVPSLWGNAPVLRSWFLSYINPVAVMERSLGRNRIQSFDEKAAEMQEMVVVRGAFSGVDGEASKEVLYVVNGVPMSATDYARIDPSAIREVKRLTPAEGTALYGSRAAGGVVMVTLKDGLEDYVTVTDNELNVVFDIDIPYDVPSNGKEQSATLREFEVNAKYKYYDVPRLDKDAYLLAEVADWEKLNLLPGEANIIFEGTYVGKSFLDPNSTLDTLNLTLGRDKRVVVRRDKLYDFSSVKFLGNYKLQKLTYEIVVKNNKKDTVKLMLKDQYPLSMLKEIEVELLDNGGAEVNKELGILTWKLEMAPGEVKKLRFSYSVRYPKDKMINLQ